MNDWQISIGDRVQVRWANDQCVVRGFVRYIPMAACDSWIIQTEDGTTYYIQQFEAMWRLPKEADK